MTKCRPRLIGGSGSVKELLLDGTGWQTADDFFRAVGAVLLSFLALTAAVAQDQCPQLSGAPRRRLEQQARWLVSPSLQRQVFAKSFVFGALIQIEQCRFLTTGVIREGDFVTAALHFTAQGYAYKSLVGRYHGTWTLAVAPDDPSTKMPEGNLLELTKRKWTLIHRDKDGSRDVVASGRY